MIDIYGFAILRNGVKYDYPFCESLTSLNDVTKKIYLALGDNEDSTKEKLPPLDLEIIPTVWDLSKREGGLILSEQTNIALSALKKAHPDSWGIYLQCDEVFHEDDYELIKEDIQKAHKEGYDTISFRYFHFWETHNQIAINKKWYPHEIRAVKLDSNIESWGDAQSFRNHKKTYFSEARIFHYGHVREESKYKEKKKDILKLYHSDEKLSKYQKREKRFDSQTECVPYLGPHPKVMQERINRLGDKISLSTKDEVYIILEDSKKLNLDKFKINAKKITFAKSVSHVPLKSRKNAIILNPSLLNKIFFPSKVPDKMRSKLAREWNLETKLILKGSEKGISFN